MKRQQVYDYEIGASFRVPYPCSLCRVSNQIEELEAKLRRSGPFTQCCSNEDADTIIAALRYNQWKFDKRSNSSLVFVKGTYSITLGYKYQSNSGYLVMDLANI